MKTRTIGSGGLAGSALGALAEAVGPRDAHRGRRGRHPAAGPDDVRSSMPRFAPGNTEHNRRLVTGLATIAASVELTTAQLALAWLLTVEPDVVAVPGTRRSRHLAENVTAAGVQLSSETMRAIAGTFPAGIAAGDRRSPFDVDIQE
ncbi:aldo/keto reductase [Actinoplanes sp. M2I2]|uniref:aldo/keto reductase n=1 Tax=Actinoplanes sp. M2I2 TaxID=1734444 RepID=UPI0020202BAF|nr:aldo/keto reductase [Actinoplanes sp. M2I2]